MRRRNEKLYWQGLRDALVMGTRDPGQPEFGPPIAEQPHYRRGFDDGKKAEARLTTALSHSIGESMSYPQSVLDSGRGK